MGHGCRINTDFSMFWAKKPVFICENLCPIKGTLISPTASKRDGIIPAEEQYLCLILPQPH